MPEQEKNHQKVVLWGGVGVGGGDCDYLPPSLVTTPQSSIFPKFQTQTKTNLFVFLNLTPSLSPTPHPSHTKKTPPTPLGKALELCVQKPHPLTPYPHTKTKTCFSNRFVPIDTRHNSLFFSFLFFSVFRGVSHVHFYDSQGGWGLVLPASPPGDVYRDHITRDKKTPHHEAFLSPAPPRG